MVKPDMSGDLGPERKGICEISSLESTELNWLFRFACALRYHLAEGELGKEVKEAVMKGLAATGTFNTMILPVNVREI